MHKGMTFTNFPSLFSRLLLTRRPLSHGPSRFGNLECSSRSRCRATGGDFDSYTLPRPRTDLVCRTSKIKLTNLIRKREQWSGYWTKFIRRLGTQVSLCRKGPFFNEQFTMFQWSAQPSGLRKTSLDKLPRNHRRPRLYRSSQSAVAMERPLVKFTQNGRFCCCPHRIPI